jgi:acyl-CoA thioester hydrolase
MKKTTTELRVRYGETDQMGVVYYGTYPDYLEQGRTEWLRELGFSYRKMEEEGIMLPVVRLEIDYRQPARYDDLITVTTSLRKIPSFKIEFDYHITDSDGNLLATAYTSLAFVDKNTGKLRRAPEYLIDRMKDWSN